MSARSGIRDDEAETGHVFWEVLAVRGSGNALPRRHSPSIPIHVIQLSEMNCKQEYIQLSECNKRFVATTICNA